MGSGIRYIYVKGVNFPLLTQNLRRNSSWLNPSFNVILLFFKKYILNKEILH
jgi:hypothetical protein